MLGLTKREGLPSNFASTCSNNSEDNYRLDSNETSDTDHRSLCASSPHKYRHWTNRRFESDLSTAPLSSETSDMDTSGNERVMTTNSLTDMNGNISSVQSPPLSRTKLEVGKGGGAGMRGHLNQVQSGTGSSGDEILSKKSQAKKPNPSNLVPSKHPPPPITKKPSILSGLGSRTLLQPGNAGVIPSKKPLQHTKSNPIASRVVQHPTNNNPRSPSSTHSPTRSQSIKPSLNVRPKPPVTAKPLSLTKPLPPPKPLVVGGNKPQPLKLTSNHINHSTSDFVGQKPRAITVGEYDVNSRIQHDTLLKKARSIENELMQLPLKKPINSAIEDRRESAGPVLQTPHVTPSSLSSNNKPSIPAKPRRLSTEKRFVMKPSAIATAPPPPPPPVKNLKLKTVVSSPLVSDSSKNPSSSDATTSGHSQSPTNSPYPSPACRKKPLVPTKMVGINKKLMTSSSLETSKDSNTRSVAMSKELFSASTTPAKEEVPAINGNLRSSVIEKPSSPPLPPVPTKEVSRESRQSPQVGMRSPHSSTSLDAMPPPLLSRDSRGTACMSNNSKRPAQPQSEIDSQETTPPPPPIRGASIANDTPKIRELSPQMTSPEATTTLTRPKNKITPRRPPPNPPLVTPTSPANKIVGQPTSDVLAENGNRRDHTSSQLSDHTSSQPSDHTQAMVLTNHYEYDTEEYFGPNREKIFDDIGYAVVKKYPNYKSKPNGVPEDHLRPPTPQEMTQDSGNASSSRGSDSELECNRGIHARKLSTTRRAPPRPPKSNSSVTYATIKCVEKKLIHQTTCPASTTIVIDENEDVPPPLPDRPYQLQKNSYRSSSTPDLLEPKAYEGLVLVQDKQIKLQTLKTREPIYDVIPDNFKKKPVRPRRDYEEIVLPESDEDMPRLWVRPERENQVVNGQSDEILNSSSPIEPGKGNTPSTSIISPPSIVSRHETTGSPATLAVEDLRENWVAEAPPPMPPLMRKRQSRSFSSKRGQSLMYRRSSSDRFKKFKVSPLDPVSLTDRVSVCNGIPLLQPPEMRTVEPLALALAVKPLYFNSMK